jgi:hypothetical protein
MDLWAILLTATVGLTGGQIGAWLQGRRDAQTQNARDRSEIERLRLQLAASREQRERELTQADTLDWRERRLAVYQKASSELEAFVKEADSVNLGSLSQVEALSEALDVSAIIGTEATRMASMSLAIAAENLHDTLSSLQRVKGSGLAAVGADFTELTKAREACDVAFDEVYIARETWHVASRSGLGVPTGCASR